MGEHETITTDIAALIDAQGGEGIITPASIALALRARYGGETVDPKLAYLSLEHLKQMARRVLSGRYSADGEENEAHQGDLFSGELQTRYPVPRQRGEEPAYKLRELLTPDEVKWNLHSLAASADARMRHYRALEAWDQSRRASA